MAWSADILQLQLGGFPQLKFVVPDEGAMLWTDSLCIPVNSQHPLDALTFMDFIYRPDVGRHDRRLDPERVARSGVAAGVDAQEGARSPTARSVFPTEGACTTGCTATAC